MRLRKTCSSCQIEKSVEEFYWSSRDGYVARCKQCSQASAKVHYEANREVRKSASRDYRAKNPDVALQRRYGIRPGTFDEMASTTDGACFICGVVPETTLCVDHCHETGRVRGLLCHPCNTALGKFGDDPEILRKAIAYLDREHDWRC